MSSAALAILVLVMRRLTMPTSARLMPAIVPLVDSRDSSICRTIFGSLTFLSMEWCAWNQASAGRARLQAEWPCFRHAAAVLVGQWGDGTGPVKPHIGVELTRQLRVAVVTPAFGVRAVDHTDETFKKCRVEALAQLRMLARAQVDHATRYAGFMEQALVAAGQRRVDLHHFHRIVPVLRCGNRPGIGSETDQRGLVAELFAAQLADVEF